MFSTPLFSQDTLISYLDWYKEVCDQDTADFKRKCYKADTIWLCQVYFKSGELNATGAFLNDSLTIKTGEWISYHKSGNLEDKSIYIDGKLEGLSRSWYDNKVLKFEGSFVADSAHGDWHWYLENGKKCAYENYNNGDELGIVFWDKKGRIQDNPQIELEPEYPGGEQEFYRFLSKKLKYPYDAYEEKIEGIVRVSFVVNSDGNIELIKIVESVDPRLDAAAMKAVKKMPNWQPGKQHNIPVRVRYTIPINFKLK